MGTRLSRAAILTLASLLVARPGASCQRTTPLPAPETLVDRAAVIVVATAVEYWRLPRTDGISGIVEFQIDETLKGTVQTGPLRLEGSLTDKDDFNEKPLSDTFVRREGRHGNCFATSYRQSGTFLLLLRMNGQKQPLSDTFRPELTPYWEPLAATNEQVHAADDPWVVWVRRRLAP